MMDEQTVHSLINWEAFETSTFDFVCECLDAYSRQYSDDASEKIYQMSIWTDPRGPITAVNFETMAHAKLHLLLASGITSEQEQLEVSAAWEHFDYRTNVAAFKHREFRVADNPALSALAEQDFFEEHEATILGWIESSLLKVVDRICSDALLRKCHVEEDVWLCNNSAGDWCDDVIRVNVASGTVTKGL